MAGNTLEEAVDAFLERVRSTLSCLADCTISRSVAAPDQTYALTAFERWSRTQNLLALVTHEGTGEVLFRFAQFYRVLRVPEDTEHGPYKIRTLAYHYRILDVADKEIALYHWHPVGGSPVTAPHLHVPAAESIQLAQPFASSRKDVKTHLGKLHFPTAHVTLEDLAEFLVRDFAVVPNRDDWRDVLQDNR